MLIRTIVLSAVTLSLAAVCAFAQDNYEIQVYPSETVDPEVTMVELHSNYTPRGMTFADGVRPSGDAVHETLEITHAFNPTFGLSFKGANENKRFDFEPNVKVAFHVTSQVDLGAEYYGTTGPVFSPDPAQEQSHAIFAAIDLNVSPEWEFNFGTGWGLTQSTDGLVVKMILGRRFGG